MITEIFKDSLADGAAKVLAATLPFITLGMLGNEWMSYVSCAIGIIAAVVVVVRFLSLLKDTTKVRKVELLDKAVSDILSFPYAMALCSAILMQAGIDASYGLWFGGLLALGVIGSVSAEKTARERQQ